MTAEQAVEGGAVIVTPKVEPVQVKFRWDPAIRDELEAIAKRTHRTINETGEILIRWAIERAKEELELAGEVAERRRK